MSHTKNITGNVFLIFIIFALTLHLAGCSDSDTPAPEPSPGSVTVTLTTDKTIFKANGKDSVTFIVKANDLEVTTSSQIFLSTESSAITSLSYKTNKAGKYTFFALYDGKKSNEIEIEASDFPILLSVDNNIIKANNKDTATFSVTADGEVLTADATISMVGHPDFLIDNASFFTKDAGNYTFFATYNGFKSNEISVEASEVVLLLSANINTIKANNKESITFTITLDGENVTNETDIFFQDDTKLEGNLFLTDNAGNYTFYAVYDGLKSNAVPIEATFVNLEFEMQYCIMQIASTICPNCPKMTNEILKGTSWNRSIFNIVSLHPYGRICNSALAGALAETAIKFADIAQISSPPAGVIDLHHPFHLYPTTTQDYITKQLNKSTSGREWKAETGIAINSKVTDGIIDFTVNVKTTNTNEYRFFAFVVEDKIIHRQRSVDSNNERIWIEDYEHNNVATYMLEGVDPLMGVSLGQIQSGQEITSKFTINTANFDTKREVNLSNCRIVAYTLRKTNGKYLIDNVTNCRVDGSVLYKYK